MIQSWVEEVWRKRVISVHNKLQLQMDSDWAVACCVSAAGLALGPDAGWKHHVGRALQLAPLSGCVSQQHHRLRPAGPVRLHALHTQDAGRRQLQQHHLLPGPRCTEPTNQTIDMVQATWFLVVKCSSVPQRTSATEETQTKTLSPDVRQRNSGEGPGSGFT